MFSRIFLPSLASCTCSSVIANDSTDTSCIDITEWSFNHPFLVSSILFQVITSYGDVESCGLYCTVHRYSMRITNCWHNLFYPSEYACAAYSCYSGNFLQWSEGNAVHCPEFCKKCYECSGCSLLGESSSPWELMDQWVIQFYSHVICYTCQTFCLNRSSTLLCFHYLRQWFVELS